MKMHLFLASQLCGITLMLLSRFSWVTDKVSINLMKTVTVSSGCSVIHGQCVHPLHRLRTQILFEHVRVLTVWQMESTLDLPWMCCADVCVSVLSSSNPLSMWAGCWLSAAALAWFGLGSAELCSLGCSASLDICSLVRSVSLLLLWPVCGAASKPMQMSQCCFSGRFLDR